MINNLYFHIHYCNGGKNGNIGERARKISRFLQHHELIYACGGTGSFEIGNKSYPVKRGSLLYIPPGVPYSIELDEKCKANFLTVHFSFTGIGFNDGRWCIAKTDPVLPLRAAQELQDALPVEEQFRKLVDKWNEKMPGYEFEARILLQQLIVAVTQNLNRHSRNYAASLKVEKLIRYMHQNPNVKITLSKLSELVQMTPFYMSRTFKTATGYTVIEYFNKLKIDRSKQLLMEGDRKIKEVAQELGFADEFYFSRMFKKAEGISPSEFCSKIVHEV